MSNHIVITLETAKHLTGPQELALIRAAYAQGQSRAMRERLAALLHLADDFDGLIDLLQDRDDLGLAEWLLLSQAWLTRPAPEGYEKSLAAAERAVVVAPDAEERGAALAMRAKAETKLGQVDAARATLAEVLALDPHSKDACKRLAAIGLEAGESDAVLALTEGLMAQGAGHARLFAAHALAHAQRGDLDAARRANGTDRFASAQKLAPPDGWDSIEAFNRDLAAELLAHPGMRFERYGSASELSWRIDSPLIREAPLVRLLLEQITKAIEAHIDRIGAVDHPWVRSRPAEAMLRSWCVLTDSDGYETWHVHQFGWLSGAYYVQIPAEVATGGGEGGCIGFGIPEEIVGAQTAAEYGVALVRPESGLLLMFPAHTYHRTFPHGLTARRICLAFDLRPY